MLAKEFVKVKITKINCLSRMYQRWNRGYVNQIMFKNKPEQLEELLSKHRKGDTYVPTELEAIMYQEALEYIQ